MSMDPLAYKVIPGLADPLSQRSVCTLYARVDIAGAETKIELESVTITDLVTSISDPALLEALRVMAESVLGRFGSD
jgi:hypothetical protein